MSQDALQKLINLISRLPGIGQRSAQRIALYLIKNKQELMLPLEESIKETVSAVKKCSKCGILDVINPCKICSSDNRVKTTICIVEDMADVWAFERSGYHKGLYHVIGGLLSASKNFTEQDLNLGKLIERITNNEVQEIILALSATIEGQTTALVIKDKLENYNIKITQLAYGVPVGSEIHYLDDNTIGAALESRKNLS
ncbi:recombination mediator RecR [Alphaproteobacteria bacterium]|nr:recombination mediator RecR [Alphaproteobacteria bacterium]